jgi:lipoprotein NlpD
LPEPAWSWPANGRVAAAFGSQEGIGTGIALAGADGQPILAAADGRVVYVGTGLAGYGQLAIVKHNDTYLSAYGHIERVVVGQGDTVARGERIASMGLGPRRQARLHFEIRRNGVPVDPLALLPSRP